MELQSLFTRESEAEQFFIRKNKIVLFFRERINVASSILEAETKVGGQEYSIWFGLPCRFKNGGVEI
jgi:hypothetical protein